MTVSEPPRPTVWIVDDSALDRQRAERALAGRYEVVTFTDGSAVLERLASSPPPACLMLDWMMPGVLGIDVVHFLRTEARGLPSVPILLLTSQQRPEQISEGLNAGANDYLAKPYADVELQARVAALLRAAALVQRAVHAESAVRELLVASPDPLVALDRDGRVLFANSEAGRVFATSEHALVGQAIAERVPELARFLHGGATDGVAVDVAIGERTFAPSVRVLETEGIHRVLALRDVTERRRLEHRRLDLYSIVAHDLRSPLGALLLRADNILLGERGEIEPPLRRDVEKMRSSCDRMVSIINDFLDLARFDGEDTPLKRVDVDLADLITVVSEDLRPLALAKQMTLELVPPKDHLAVIGDAAKLGQVVANLVGNAIKFSPPASTVVVAGYALPDEVIELSVTDQGPGVPAHSIATLFDRFTRADTGRPIAGTGLGLMIVRQIVEAHGGRTGVECPPGAGSRFWVRLPRSPQTAS